MKKAIIILSLLLISLSFSCYDASQDARVRVNLANMPQAQDVLSSPAGSAAPYRATTGGPLVSRVHIAAYTGNSILAAGSFTAADVTANGNIIELSIPAGKSIAILVVGEYNDGQGNIYGRYFGVTTADCKAGETTDVNVQVYENTGGSGSAWFSIIGLSYAQIGTTGTYNITWNSPGFPVKYYLYNGSGVLMYEGHGTGCLITNMPPSLYLEFEAFRLKTADFTIGW